MRVTELTKQNAVRSNLSNNAEEMQRTMIGMSSGKRINKPSDDPVGAARVQDFRTSINRSKTLERNIGADKVWLNTSESALQQIGDVLQHVKVLALEGANSTSTREFRQSVAMELRTIVRDLVKLGNKREGKLSLFAGTKTLTKPLEIKSEVLTADVFLDNDTLKSTKKIIPLNQNKAIEAPESKSPFGIDLDIKKIFPLGGSLEASSFNIILHGPEQLTPEGEPIAPTKIRIDLNGTESIKQAIEKINKAAIAESNHKPSAFSPTGFQAKVYAGIGDDNLTALEPAEGYTLSLERITGENSGGFFGFSSSDEEAPNDFLSVMGFKLASPESEDEDGNGGPVTTRFKTNREDFDAHWVGFSNNEYMVRITRGGEFGKAQFIVSDDNGKNWSQPKILQKKTEIFNPDGQPNDHMDLQFGAAVNPFFREGMELFFSGNQFVEYKGNDQKKEVLIDNGIKVALNVTARELFFQDPADEDTVNLFDMLQRLIKSLDADDPRAVMKSLGQIDGSMNQVLKGRAKIGAIVRELEDSEERIAQNHDFKSEELSKIEDMDFVKGAIDMNSAEVKNKTALDSAARLIQPTLVNFLK
ncbi:MAG: hypothetical protein COB67_03295 [SAR324 cluster bacterium]|uniref:Flagellin n=1 Tax=SAR324 cluster bacterium TaxID=2024889 RepID=A0A2A4T8U8_9DELT|nr:MAG: hypothetical protein COB67_03295 [SAR324 cluster bacterium]